MNANTTVPDYVKEEVGGYPLLLEGPRQYRFDGSLGVFKTGTIVTGGNLWLQPIAIRWVEEERLGRTNQTWLDVLFVDADHVLSVMPLKKDSAINLADYLARLRSGSFMGTKIAYQACWLELQPHQLRTLEGEPYFVAIVTQFRFASEEQLAGVRELRKLPPEQLPFLIVGEREHGQ